MSAARRERDADASLFEELIEPLLASGAAEEGTIMGRPCLRTPGGAFLAMAGSPAGELIVKIPAARVEELIAAGAGLPFAPAGRRFREWVRVPQRDPVLWQALLDEARAFAEGEPRGGK